MADQRKSRIEIALGRFGPAARVGRPTLPERPATVRPVATRTAMREIGGKSLVPELRLEPRGRVVTDCESDFHGRGNDPCGCPIPWNHHIRLCKHASRIEQGMAVLTIAVVVCSALATVGLLVAAITHGSAPTHIVSPPPGDR